MIIVAGYNNDNNNNNDIMKNCLRASCRKAVSIFTRKIW